MDAEQNVDGSSGLRINLVPLGTSRNLPRRMYMYARLKHLNPVPKEQKGKRKEKKVDPDPFFTEI